MLVEMSPSAMLDKLTSRLSSGAQRTQHQSVYEDGDLPSNDGDELKAIDDILAISRRHPLTELPPAPHGLTPNQVCIALLLFNTHIATVFSFVGVCLSCLFTIVKIFDPCYFIFRMLVHLVDGNLI